MSAKKPEFEVSILKKEHAQSAIKLFVESFCDSEPITKELDIPYEHYKPFAEAVINKAIKDGISVVAVNRHKEVIACAIAEDMTNLFEPNVEQYPKIKPVFDLLDQLSAPFLKNKKFKQGKMAHVWIAIVDHNHRGIGLSTAIDMACGELLVLKGYDFVYAEFTNDLSEKIAYHYDAYSLCHSIDYRNFTLSNGEKPFANVKGTAAAYIIGIRPGLKLDALTKCYQQTEVC